MGYKKLKKSTYTHKQLCGSHKLLLICMQTLSFAVADDWWGFD